MLLPKNSRRSGGLPADLLGIALALVLALPSYALSQEFRTSSAVQLDAPDNVRSLLQNYLRALPPEDRAIDDAERSRLIRQLREEITGLLATEGYFTPEIIVADGEPGKLRVVVSPGKRAHVSDLEIEFVGHVVAAGETGQRRMESLRESWELKPGAPFRQADWDRSKQKLLDGLLAQDYAAARIAESRAEVDPDRATVKLRVHYNSGPVFTLGELEVSGLKSYSVELVQRYNRIRPGDRYDQERLYELQRALQNTPYFSAVVVDVERDPEKPDNVPVRILLSESRAKRLGLGAGISSNTGLRGQVTYRDADLFDRAWNFATGISLSNKESYAHADVRLPPADKDYRDSFGVLAERTDIEGLKIDRASAAAVRAWARGRLETRFGLNLLRERQQATSGANEVLTALTLNGSWTYRTVDNPLDPRTGYVLNVQLGGGAQALLSDQNFVRGYARYQHFFPIGERDAMILRGELGVTVAPERRGVPDEFLFRTGGSQSVRGYAYRSLGVRQDDAVLGGRFLATASAEYVHWFDQTWGGAVFCDAGDAADSRDAFSIHTGYGMGARWRSPVGPLALDLAYGQRDQRLRVHFAVSIAF